VTAEDMAHGVRGEGQVVVLPQAMGEPEASQVGLLPRLDH